MRAFIISVIMLISTPAAVLAGSCGVDIQARFIEGAPRDRFVIENRSVDAISISQMTLDLAPSAGRLIFDTESGGSGVEVFQLYKDENSSAALVAAPKVKDGDDALSLQFLNFNPGEIYRFSIDVDDQLTDSDLGQIRVSGGEMAGAEISVTLADGSIRRATFDAGNQPRLSSGCL